MYFIVIKINKFQTEIVNVLKETNIEKLSPLESFGLLQNLINKANKG